MVFTSVLAGVKETVIGRFSLYVSLLPETFTWTFLLQSRCHILVMQIQVILGNWLWKGSAGYTGSVNNAFFFSQMCKDG